MERQIVSEKEAVWRLAAIVENSHDAIISKDLNGVITTWNAGAEHLFGYTAEEAVGNSITIIIPAERFDEEPEILDRIRGGGLVKSFETVRLRKDGSRVDISLTISPIKDADGRVVGASKIARDIGERKRAEARQELLKREIDHRTKNLFAVVNAVVDRSFDGKQTLDEAKAAVLSRLSSLAQTHGILFETTWEGADLQKLVDLELSPYVERVKIEGRSLMLRPRAAQDFSLALHELATNAAKYGALSNEAGWIEVSWFLGRLNGSQALTFRWREHGGPRVTAPERRGFGSTILERVMSDCFTKPRINLAPSGVSYELHAPLDAISQSKPRLRSSSAF